MRILPKVLFQICRYIPIKISDEEVVVRAIFSPYHVNRKNNKLTTDAFMPTPGTDEISVMRLMFLGPHRCKKKGLDMANPNKKFHGFAVLSVKSIRDTSLSVIDSRKQNYRGHADIKTGIAAPLKGAPRSPEELARSKKISDLLVARAAYYPDRVPKHRRWKSGELIAPQFQAASASK